MIFFCSRFAEFIEGSPHLTEAEVGVKYLWQNNNIYAQVMDYSHWDYNTDDEDGGKEDIYTDDEEADEAASDENLD